jgi:hypothetical protein
LVVVAAADKMAEETVQLTVFLEALVVVAEWVFSGLV